MFRIVPPSIFRSFSRHGVPSLSYTHAVSKPVWQTPLLCVQWKTPDDGQRNCPKQVEFYSKNKFEKLVRLVRFIIRIYHLDVRVHSWEKFPVCCISFKIIRQNSTVWLKTRVFGTWYLISHLSFRTLRTVLLRAWNTVVMALFFWIIFVIVKKSCNYFYYFKWNV